MKTFFSSLLTKKKNTINYLSPSPFICPSIRIRRRDGYQKIGKETYPIACSYHISDAPPRDHEVIQKHQLFLLNNKEGESNGIYCNACKSHKIGTTNYFCNQCNYSYHKECVESPPIVISPFHPKFPLQLLILIPGIAHIEACHSCGLRISGSFFYYSSICHLSIDPVCAMKREFPAINNPKRHQHMLHYFPRKASIACDVCGLVDNKFRFYVCFQCYFVVHVTCIYLPYVILISHHNHRLSFTSSLSSENLICGICRRKIDEKYGKYSCTKGCAYAVHSKCATQPYVWDGKELEDQPETVYDNIKSFEEMGDGTIRHFSHAHHHMRLNEDIGRGVYDEEQYCEACMLPLYDGNVYRCMECDFALHESCANLPRLKQNVMHRHWLTLEPKIPFNCSACYRESCGFSYVCEKRCSDFKLDVRCASLPELVDHKSHPHPFFFNHERRYFLSSCSACGNYRYGCLSCVECDFVSCFRCATLPYKVKNEDDEHMLTLSYERSASGHPYWCQVCEETTDPKKGYYQCNECGVTFHIECTFRIDNPYVKAGQVIVVNDQEFAIIPNNHLNRLICNECQRRCQHKTAYQTFGKIYCSLEEIYRYYR